MNKEQNFVSVVVRISDDSDKTLLFYQTIYTCLLDHFSQFELIAVNADSSVNKAEKLREWAKTIQCPLTIINMSKHQPHEQCMNAGLDCAIGDYIYEFDSVNMPYSADLIWRAYETALEGNDIVTVCPTNERWTSRQFYRIFNANSRAAYPIRTDAFRLVSRRALNRTHLISGNLPYRKAAYAASGLKMAELDYEGCFISNEKERVSLAVDSLVLYTDFGYKFSVGFTAVMILATIIELLYTVLIWIAGHPIAGWTTTMFVLTFGLTGLFAVLAIILKYVSLLLRISFQKQQYLVESIEKV